MNPSNFVTPLLAAGLALLLLAPLAAGAGEKTPFLDAVSRAYPHLKMSWFYTRTGSGGVAALEIAAFREAWAGIESRFSTAPPPRFAADVRWRQSLSAISAIAGRALDHVDSGRLKAAHGALGEARRTLSELRRRNGVVVFSDHVDAYGVHVARLTEIRKALRKSGRLTPKTLDELRRIAVALTAAVRNISDNAPPKLTRNSAFLASIEGNFKSIGKLERGIRRTHLKAIIGSVAAVRSVYVLLFIRYG